MSSGESLIAIGAMIILGLLSLSYQKSQSVQVTSSITYESVVASSGIAQSLMEEISGYAFDEETTGSRIESKDELTAHDDLGPEPSENIPDKYDDIDDFDGYVQIDTLARLGEFTCSVKVSYVDSTNYNLKAMYKSWLKRVDIAVVNAYLQTFKDEETGFYESWFTADTLYFSHIMSY